MADVLSGEQLAIHREAGAAWCSEATFAALCASHEALRADRDRVIAERNVAIQQAATARDQAAADRAALAALVEVLCSLPLNLPHPHAARFMGAFDAARARLAAPEEA